MLGCSDRPASRPRVAEPCMTHDDSVPIGATSLAPRRALAHMRRAERACGRDAMRDVVASGHGRAPVGRKKGSVARPRGKFSALQSIENSQNGERISILREHLPRAGGTPRTKEDGATRGWRGSPKRSRREMAPQRFEKIESGPGNGMGSEASNLLDLVHGRAADRTPLRLTSARMTKLQSCRKRRLTL